MNVEIQALHFLRGKRIDNGNKVPAAQLPELLVQVKGDVDALLGCEGTDTPSVQYYSPFRLSTNLVPWTLLGAGAYNLTTPLTDIFDIFIPAIFVMTGLSAFGHILSTHPRYDPGRKRIDLLREPLPLLVSTLGHEYTHHRQGLIKAPSGIFNRGGRYDIVIEGQARGVQKWIAQLYHQRTDNLAYLSFTDQNVEEIYQTYGWMCGNLGRGIRTSIQRGIQSVQQSDLTSLELFPGSHAAGNTLFTLLEAQQGHGVYKAALSPDFCLS